MEGATLESHRRQKIQSSGSFHYSEVEDLHLYQDTIKLNSRKISIFLPMQQLLISTDLEISAVKGDGSIPRNAYLRLVPLF